MDGVGADELTNVARLVHLAHQRVGDMRAQPSRLSEHLPDVDEMENKTTGAKISLAQAVALRELFPRASHVSELSAPDRARLLARRRELVEKPEAQPGWRTERTRTQ